MGRNTLSQVPIFSSWTRFQISVSSFVELRSETLSRTHTKLLIHTQSRNVMLTHILRDD